MQSMSNRGANLAHLSRITSKFLQAGGGFAEIGIGLTCFGVLFTLLGVLFFFDKGLLAMGNILFVCGLALTIGPGATVRFFMRRKHWKGSGFFIGGFALVIIGWPMIGMVLETYGFWLLFSTFFPTLLGFLRKVPMLNKILDLPVLKTVLNKIAPPQSYSLPV